MPMAGTPDSIRHASTASAPQATTPAGRSPRSAPSTTSLGPNRSVPLHPFHSKGSPRTPALRQHREQPRSRVAHCVTAERQAAPRQRLDLHLGSEQEAAQARRHRVAVAAFDVEHEPLAVGPGHPEQRRQLSVRLEQERVGRRPDRRAVPGPGSAGPAGTSRPRARVRRGRRGGAEGTGAVPQGVGLEGEGVRGPDATPARVHAPPRPARRAHPARRRHRHQECAGLVRALLVLALGVAVGHDPRAGLHAGPAVGRHHHGADGDGGVEVAREVDVARPRPRTRRAWSARARR